MNNNDLRNAFTMYVLIPSFLIKRYSPPLSPSLLRKEGDGHCFLAPLCGAERVPISIWRGEFIKLYN